MGLRGCIPRQYPARATGSLTCRLERDGILEELAGRARERLNVSGRNDAPRAEPFHRLTQPPDVVDDCGDAGAERLQQCAALIELRPVGKERDGRITERALELALGEIAEAPLGGGARLGPVAVHRLERLAGDEQADAVELPCHFDGVAQALVGTDRAETQQRTPVVSPGRIGCEDRMRNDARVDAEPGERLPPALAVDHDAVEAAQQLLPERDLAGGPAWKQVVRGEDRRHAWTEENAVE